MPTALLFAAVLFVVGFFAGAILQGEALLAFYNRQPAGLVTK